MIQVCSITRSGFELFGGSLGQVRRQEVFIRVVVRLQVPRQVLQIPWIQGARRLLQAQVVEDVVVAAVVELSNDASSPALIAALLVERGFGSSRISVFEHLGGPAERRIDGHAQAWEHTAVADLNLVAIDCLADANAPRLSRLAGLPDSAFKHDGQLTKRDVRAMTLARLAPMPGELLWDVGAGSGSIGIEWMRTHPSCRALAIEADTGRQGLIEHNRDALGVPGLQLVRGKAPAALTGLETPDAIFIGGGVTRDGVLDTCWQRLRPGGRLVANAVTLQSEMTLMNWRAEHGGELTRIHVAQAQPLGEFDTWRQALPITLLEVIKPL